MEPNREGVHGSGCRGAQSSIIAYTLGVGFLMLGSDSKSEVFRSLPKVVPTSPVRTPFVLAENLSVNRKSSETGHKEV